MGADRGLEPSTTLRSLWQIPEASIRTSTSPDVGGRTSSASVNTNWSPSNTIPRTSGP